MIYIRGQDNIITNCLLRSVNNIEVDATDFPEISKMQNTDEKVKKYLKKPKTNQWFKPKPEKKPKIYLQTFITYLILAPKILFT